MLATRWQRDKMPLARIAVNISGVQLLQQDFIQQVQRIFVETGVDTATIELELTESWMMQDLAQSAAALQSLKALGVRIAIDDFGTGYSSLAYLKQFPLNTLKIDKAFVISGWENIFKSTNGLRIFSF